MPPPTNPAPTTLTEQASEFFKRFTGGTDDAPKAGWPDFHAALVKFIASHTSDEPHLDLIRDVLIRGIRLLQAAISWETPVAGGKSGAPSDTDRARGEQWRLVMAFAGFELVTKAALDRADCTGLRFCDFQTLVAEAVLVPICPPIPSPQAAPKIVSDWLSPVGTAGAPILAFLGLFVPPTKRLEEWLVTGIDRTTWEDILAMAQCLRHATAHGFLSASKSRELKIVPLLNDFVLRLEDVVTGVIRRLNEF